MKMEKLCEKSENAFVQNFKMSDCMVLATNDQKLKEIYATDSEIITTQSDDGCIFGWIDIFYAYHCLKVLKTFAKILVQ